MPNWIVNHIKFLIKIFGLDDWIIHLDTGHFVDTEDEIQLGEAFITPQYLEARLSFSDKLTEERNKQSNTTLHETTHILFADIDYSVRHYLIPLMRKKNQIFATVIWLTELEKTVTKFTKIFGKLTEKQYQEFLEELSKNENNTGEND